MKKSNRQLKAYKEAILDNFLLKLIITTILVVRYLLFPKVGFNPEGMAGFDIYNNIVFPLSHANIFHLLCNILCLWYIRRLSFYLPPAIAISFICSFFPENIHNIMGFSGVLFSIIGLIYGENNRGYDMIKNNWIFFFVTAFIPNVAVLFHIYCLIFSFFIGKITTDIALWKKATTL